MKPFLEVGEGDSEVLEQRGSNAPNFTKSDIACVAAHLATHDPEFRDALAEELLIDRSWASEGGILMHEAKRSHLEASIVRALGYEPKNQSGLGRHELRVIRDALREVNEG